MTKQFRERQIEFYLNMAIALWGRNKKNYRTYLKRAKRELSRPINEGEK